MIEDLSDFEKNFQDLIISIASAQTSECIVQGIQDHIQSLSSAMMSKKHLEDDEDEAKEFVEQITSIRQIGFEIGQVHEFMLSQISEIICSQFQSLSPSFIADVSSKLRKDKLGLLIIQENSKNFEGLLNKIIEEVSKNQFSLEYVNKSIRGDDFIVDQFST